MTLVRTRTIPTERPLPVGEVGANFWSEFLATDTEVPGSIPGATRFSE